MEAYNRADAVDFYFSEIEAGHMGISDIRPKLEARKLDPAEIKVVVRLVDDMVIRAEQRRTDKKVGRGIFWGGVVLATIAGLITVLTYTGVIAIAGGTRYIVMHGPFAAGLLAMGGGWSKMNR